MSNVQTSADRHLHDLSRFVFSSGTLGRLKVLDTTLVQPGDSFEMDMHGVLRLSPLRRGLSVDSQCDIFSFYMPHRRSIGDVWVDFLKAGPASGLVLPRIGIPTAVDGRGSFLGSQFPLDEQCPTWMANTYMSIFNNYFKNPYDPDTPWATLDEGSVIDGLRCANLKTLWTAPLPTNVTSEFDFTPDASGSIDLFSLNAAHGMLHTKQERELFAQRYRDLVESMGGNTHYDADGRPQLLMRSKFWASGYDIDGTDASSLGQFSGRVQQSYNHKVPRFFVPEHGCIMTVMLLRFPPIHTYSMPYLIGEPSVTYEDIVGDPSVDGNQPPVKVSSDTLFRFDNGFEMMLPWGQWHRSQPSHVDFRYQKLQGFPFMSSKPVIEQDVIFYSPAEYDQCFQTTQLGHWNTQLKTNVTVLRALPTARDAVMVS